MQAAIIAGGLATRLLPLTADRPKLLVDVCGRPFIDYQLALLRSGGVTDVVLCIGHLGEQIRAHVGDGSTFGLRVRYSDEGEAALGVAGALKRAEPLLGDWFLVTYGDGYLQPDYPAAAEAFLAGGARAMMLISRNTDPQHRNEVRVEDGVITAFDKVSAGPAFEFLNYGVTFMRRDALAVIAPGAPCTEDVFYGALIARGWLRAYVTDAPIIEIGRAPGLEAFRRLVEAGVVATPEVHP